MLALIAHCAYHAYELMIAANSIVQIDLSLRRETMKFVLTLDCRPCRIPHEIAELEVACFAFVIDLLHQGPVQSQGLDDRQFGFRMCQRNSPMNCNCSRAIYHDDAPQIATAQFSSFFGWQNGRIERGGSGSLR